MAGNEEDSLPAEVSETGEQSGDPSAENEAPQSLEPVSSDLNSAGNDQPQTVAKDSTKSKFLFAMRKQFSFVRNKINCWIM